MPTTQEERQKFYDMYGYYPKETAHGGAVEQSGGYGGFGAPTSSGGGEKEVKDVNWYVRRGRVPPPGTPGTVGTQTVEPEAPKKPTITQGSDEGYVIPGMGSAEADAWGRMQYYMGQGRKRGQELFGEGSLQMPGQMLSDRDRMFSALRSQMQGLTSPEFQAIRGRAAQGLESQMASNLRRLRNEQGLGGVTGAARTAGAQNVMAGADRQRRELERDLLMQDIGLRRAGTQAMGGALGTFGGMEMDRIRREKMGQLGTEMGYAGLGSQIHGDIAAERLGQQLLKQAGQYPIPREPRAISAENMFADQPWTRWMFPGPYVAHEAAKRLPDWSIG